LGNDWVAQNLRYYFDMAKPFTRTGTPTNFASIKASALIQRRIQRFEGLNEDTVHEQHAAEWAELVDEFDTYAQDLGDWYRNDKMSISFKYISSGPGFEPTVWRRIDYSTGTKRPDTPMVSPRTVPAAARRIHPPRSLRSMLKKTFRGRRANRQAPVDTTQDAYKTLPIRPPRSRSSSERAAKRLRTSEIDLDAFYGYHDAFPRRRWEVPSPIHEHEWED